MPEKNRILDIVRHAGRMLALTMDTDEAIRGALAIALEATDSEGGSILVHEEPSGLLRFRHVVGGKGEELIGFAIPDTEGIAGHVFQTGKPMASNEIFSDPLHSRQVDQTFGFETQSIVTVPIRYLGGKSIGVLQLINKRDGTFGDAELEIIAGIAAMSIINADLAMQSQKSEMMANLVSLARNAGHQMSPRKMSVQTLEFVADGGDAEPGDVGDS